MTSDSTPTSQQGMSQLAMSKWRWVGVTTLILALLHAVCGVVSVAVGVVSTAQSPVWLAHSVSPIWSGVCFLVTSGTGFMCYHKPNSSYWLLLFAALSATSLLTGIVSVQLLRVGLVHHTTDGHTFEKDDQDPLIVTALAAAAFEGVACLGAAVISVARYRLLRGSREGPRRGSAFTILLQGNRDILIQKDGGLPTQQHQEHVKSKGGKKRDVKNNNDANAIRESGEIAEGCKSKTIDKKNNSGDTGRKSKAKTDIGGNILGAVIEEDDEGDDGDVL